MGPGKHFVRYFVASMRYVNFVAIVEQDLWTKESWTDRGDVHDARSAFAGWHKDVSGVLDAVEETFIWGLFDRAPLACWSVGRVTLLGDACHPMLPFVAQGAAQALEDGVTLTACLQKYEDIPEALAHYQTLRLPRTAHVQSLAASNKIRFHLQDGPASVGSAVLPPTPSRARNADANITQRTRANRLCPWNGGFFGDDADGDEPRRMVTDFRRTEGVGFEPTREREPPAGFQDRCLKPLGHPST